MSQVEREVIGECVLIHADCRDVLDEIRADALVTDPPYGLGLGRENNQHRNGGYGAHLGKQAYRSYDDTYQNFSAEIVPRVNSALDHTRCAAVFSGPHIHEQRKPTAIGGIYLMQSAGRTPWGSKNFLPVLFYGNPPGAGQHRPTVICDSSRPEPSEHPCPKPLAWMLWLVRLASRPHETVLDPFAGSFTTGVACVQLGRRFIGIKLDPYYWEIGCQRITDAYKQPDLFLPRSPQPTQQALWALGGGR